MKFKVKWTVTGEYEVTSQDLDLSEEEASLDGAKEVIADDPYVGIEYETGKLSYEVTEV